LGIVLEPVARMAPGVKARDVLRVLDPEPVVSPELLTLGLWIAEYYIAPVGEVFRAMLPLRRETRRARVGQITDRGRETLTEPAPQLAVQGPVPARATRPSPVARRILEVLEREGPAADHRELLNSARASLAALRKLDASGLVELSDAKRGPKQHSRESGDNT